jgi:hypothetical protein
VSLVYRIQEEEGSEVTHSVNTTVDDASYSKSIFELEENESKQEQRILGVIWDTCSDKMVLDFNHIVQEAGQLEPTKIKNGSSSSQDL